MKKSYFILLLATVVLATFSGCKKSGTSSPTYFMKASLGGTAYDAPNCIIFSMSGTTIIEGLGGTSSVPTYPYVALNMPTWSGTTGTVALDSTLTHGHGQYLTSTTSYKISKTGSVNITAVTSTSVSGTFSFTCQDGTSVSGGTFTAKKM